jgi:low affinity Fe/Cu permease
MLAVVPARRNRATFDSRIGYSAARRAWLVDAFAGFARAVNRFVASPAATAAAFAIVIVWALCGPAAHYSDGWQLIINTGTTIITFLMVFVLNNAQSRDTSAMNAKLDAVIIALENADNRLVGLELKTEAESRALADEIQASIAEKP